jgi:hypothetical protein
MLNVTRQDVVNAPFPHAVVENVLDPSLYARLKADFPRRSDDAAVPNTGSRVGKGKGFDIYRGDERYDQLVSSSAAWREFEAWINSPAFIQKFLDVFGDQLGALGIGARIDPDQYQRDMIEPREVLKETQSTPKRVIDKLAKLVDRPDPSKPVPLFTRLDIEKSTSGYAKRPHCDRRNRLCSLIVYFCDAEERGLDGGDLQIFEHVEATDVRKMPRHPAPDEVREVARLKPRDNLGVFFPCSNNSYHGVTEIRSEGIERDFLYINISGETRSLWG